MAIIKFTDTSGKERLVDMSKATPATLAWIKDNAAGAIPVTLKTGKDAAFNPADMNMRSVKWINSNVTAEPQYPFFSWKGLKERIVEPFTDQKPGQHVEAGAGIRETQLLGGLARLAAKAVTVGGTDADNQARENALYDKIANYDIGRVTTTSTENTWRPEEHPRATFQNIQMTEPVEPGARKVPATPPVVNNALPETPPPNSIAGLEGMFRNKLADAGGPNMLSGVGSLGVDLLALKGIGMAGGAALDATGKAVESFAALDEAAPWVGKSINAVKNLLTPKPLTSVVFNTAGEGGLKVATGIAAEMGKAGVKDALLGGTFETALTGDPVKGLKAMPGWFTFGAVTHGASMGVAQLRSPELINFARDLSKFDNVNEEQAANIVKLVNATAKANNVTFDDYMASKGITPDTAPEKILQTVFSKGSTVGEKAGEIWNRVKYDAQILPERIKYGVKTPSEPFLENKPDASAAIDTGSNFEGVIKQLTKMWYESVPDANKGILNMVKAQSISSPIANELGDLIPQVNQTVEGLGRVKNPKEAPQFTADQYADMFMRYIKSGSYPSHELKPVFDNFRKWVSGYADAEPGTLTDPLTKTWFSRYFSTTPATLSNSFLSSRVGNPESYFGKAWHYWVSSWDTLAAHNPTLKELFKRTSGVKIRALKEMAQIFQPLIEGMKNLEPVEYKNAAGTAEQKLPYSVISDFMMAKRMKYLMDNRPEVELPKEINGKPLKDFVDESIDTLDQIRTAKPEQYNQYMDIIGSPSYEGQWWRDNSAEPGIPLEQLNDKIKASARVPHGQATKDALNEQLDGINSQAERLQTKYDELEKKYEDKVIGQKRYEAKKAKLDEKKLALDHSRADVERQQSVQTAYEAGFTSNESGVYGEPQNTPQAQYKGLYGADEYILDQWYKSGALSSKDMAFMREENPFHMPIYRVFSKAEEEAFKTGGAKGIKKLVGSTRDINDVIENLMHNYVSMVPAMIRNQNKIAVIDEILRTSPELVNKVTYSTEPKTDKFMQVLEQEALDGSTAKVVRLLREPRDLGPDEVILLRKGKWEKYVVHDPLLKDVLNPRQGLVTIDGPAGIWAAKLAIAMKNIKRGAITSIPEFVFRNMFRDSATVIAADDNIGRGMLFNMATAIPTWAQHVYTDYMKNLFSTMYLGDGLIKRIIDTDMPGISKILNPIGENIETALNPKTGINRADLMRRAEQAGIGESEMVRAIKPKDMQAFIKKWLGTGKGKVYADPGLLKGTLKAGENAWGLLTSPSNLIEKMPRFAALERQYVEELAKQGYDLRKNKDMNIPEKVADEAIKNAVNKYRDITVDFGEMGSTSKLVGKYIPFFTAAIGGGRTGLLRTLENPAGVLSKSAGLLTVPSVVAWFYNKDQDWYKNMPSMEKMMTIPISEHIRIPLPYEYGVVMGSAPVAILDRIYQGMIQNGMPKEQANARLAEDLSNAWQLFFPISFDSTIMPPAVEYPVGSMMNKNLFFNTPIESPYNVDKPPYMRFNPATPEVYKAASKIISKVPALKDKDAFSPNMLNYALSVFAGNIPNTLMKPLDPLFVNKAGMPASDLSQMPGVRGFYKQNPSEASFARAVTDFYNASKEVRQTLTELKELQKNRANNPDDYYAARDKAKWALRLEEDFRNRQQRITDLLDRHRKIASPNNVSYSPDEKKQRMAELMRRVVEIAEIGNEKFYQKREDYK